MPVAHPLRTDFENRKEEITQQLVEAAESTGFFALVDHVLSVEEIERQFALSKVFFAHGMEIKNKTPYDTSTSLGYENKVISSTSQSCSFELKLTPK
jgi:isopenicillin N synthase-like dioxygenase